MNKNFNRNKNKFLTMNKFSKFIKMLKISYSSINKSKNDENIH